MARVAPVKALPQSIAASLASVSTKALKPPVGSLEDEVMSSRLFPRRVFQFEIRHLSVLPVPTISPICRSRLVTFAVMKLPYYQPIGVLIILFFKREKPDGRWI
jgi:hypothetical protein